jgi:hypothetical protein
MADPELMRAFSAIATEAELFAAVIGLGHREGLDLTTGELEEAVRANRRAWFERWVTH